MSSEFPAIRSYVPMVMELVFCRFVDRYLIYLSEVLGLLFRMRPEMMKSNEKVDVCFVLVHASKEELIASLAERKVMALAYSGMREVANYFAKNIHLSLFETTEQLELCITAVELRNLFTHNNGIVNRTFKDRRPLFECTLGEQFSFKRENGLLEYEKILLISSLWLNVQVLEKFGIVP